MTDSTTARGQPAGTAAFMSGPEAAQRTVDARPGTTGADPEPPAAASLGGRLRAERQRAGLSLRALARAVNVSASFVSQVENDKAQPSVSTLYALSQRLGISVDGLFPATESALAVAGSDEPLGANGYQALAASRTGARGGAQGPVTRAGQGRRIELESGVRWERLGGSAGNAQDFLLVTYEPGGSSSTGGEKLMRHSGHEFGYVLRGSLSVQLGFEEYLLRVRVTASPTSRPSPIAYSTQMRARCARCGSCCRVTSTCTDAPPSPPPYFANPASAVSW